MQPLELFAENEKHNNQSLLKPNFELVDESENSTLYCCLDTKRILRLLSSFARPQNYKLYNIIASDNRNDRYRYRLSLTFKDIEPGNTRTLASELLQQWKRVPAQSVSLRTLQASIHLLYSAKTRQAVAVWPAILVDGKEITRTLGRYLHPNFDENNTSLVLTKQLMPNTGSLGYELTILHDGSIVVESSPLEKLFTTELLVQINTSELTYTDKKQLPTIRDGSSKAGMSLSPNFRFFLKRQKQQLRASMSSSIAEDEYSSNISMQLELEEKYREYKAEIKDRLTTVIDVRDTSNVWSPNTLHNLLEELLPLILRGAKDLMFSEATNLLNKFMARERAPGSLVWIKVPSRDPDSTGASLVKRSMSEMLKERAGITIKLPAPLDEELRQKCLRNVSIDKDSDTFYFMDWYLKHGCREVIGPRFMPLSLRAQPTDDDQVDYINTFQGFKVHEWLADEEAVSLSEEYYNKLIVEVNWLRGHIRNLCGGTEEAARLLHGWFAHLAFAPDKKSMMPIMPVIVGPQGCGKTSLVEAYVKLLNACHARIITSFRHLTGHFNADSEKTCLTHCEEMDLKNQGTDQQAALQQLISGGRIMGENKGIDGEMRKDYNRFVLISNTNQPVVAHPTNRRYMVFAFDPVVGNRLGRDNNFRQEYLSTLAELLKRDDVWRGYSFYLYREFYSKLDDFAEEMCTRRYFSLDTTVTQLTSMIRFKEWSVVGWLFLNLHRYGMFIEDPARLILDCGGANRNFLDWDNWAAMTNVELDKRDKRVINFTQGKWSALVDKRHARNWWQKVTADELYSSYVRLARKEARLSQADWMDELRKILIRGCSEQEQPALLEQVEITRDKDNKVKCVQWLAMPPLDRLEELVERMLPGSMGFSWNEYRAKSNSSASARLD